MASASDSETDARLLDGVRDLRNEKAWAAFRDRYERLIRACCLKHGLRAEAADELSQAVLAKLVEKMPDFVYEPGGRFRAWLRTLVRSAVIDQQRLARRHPGDHSTGDTAYDTRRRRPRRLRCQPKSFAQSNRIPFNEP
jgi:RNA polymerase sigma factor (sigma-70 family)